VRPRRPASRLPAWFRDLAIVLGAIAGYGIGHLGSSFGSGAPSVLSAAPSPVNQAPRIQPCGSLGTGESADVGWGPDRPGYPYQQPPSFISLNAIDNTPNYGDERRFF
jgi:hypothetical protein